MWSIRASVGGPPPVERLNGAVAGGRTEDGALWGLLDVYPARG